MTEQTRRDEIIKAAKESGRMLVGLSLSFCVRDIAQGLVDFDSVAKVITGTRCETEDNWNALVDSYCRSYWRNDIEKCVAVFNQLKSAGLIEQARLNKQGPPNISKGHWTHMGDMIQYHDYFDN